MRFHLSRNVKGMLCFIGGLIAFFYTIDWFRETLHYIMLSGSIAAIIYGFIVTDMWDKLNDLINQFRKSDDNNSVDNDIKDS